jgi:glyoxylase-like metal-dependent hydrolase (beta-lactamase superfamily II)
MGKIRFLLSAFVLALGACASAPAPTSATVQRLYVIDCGEARTQDLSPWTTPEDAGKPYIFPDHCYLIKHAKGWMLWDSGLPDAYASRPEGVMNPRRTSTAFVHKPLVESLREIGVAPRDIAYFAMSHTHSDHAGNANLFADATVYVQSAEYDAMFGAEPQKLGFVPTTYDQLRNAPRLVKLDGDHDVFGDGAVVIKSTPGHTPGHQSLLVRLAKTGPVLLTGDAVHFRANWEAHRAPRINFDPQRSLRTMDEIAAFTKQTGAQMWINHDAEQSRTLKKAPQYYE